MSTAHNLYQEKIINLETNEIVLRDYSAEEIAEVEAAQAEALLRTEQAAQKQAAKEAAQAKLAGLGLTTEDLKALGL